MNDIEVYDRVHSGPAAGMELERAMALRVETQRALDRVAGKIQKQAKASLAAGQASWEYSEGDSQVLPVESGDIDRFVVLSDERGLQAAWMIEVGNFDVHLGPNSARFKGNPITHRPGRKQAGKSVLRGAAFSALLRGGF